MHGWAARETGVAETSVLRRVGRCQPHGCVRVQGDKQGQLLCEARQASQQPGSDLTMEHSDCASLKQQARPLCPTKHAQQSMPNKA